MVIHDYTFSNTQQHGFAEFIEQIPCISIFVSWLCYLLHLQEVDKNTRGRELIEHLNIHVVV